MPSHDIKDKTRHTQDADQRWQESTTDAEQEVLSQEGSGPSFNFPMTGIPSPCIFFYFSILRDCYFCSMRQTSPCRFQRASRGLQASASSALLPASLFFHSMSKVSSGLCHFYFISSVSFAGTKAAAELFFLKPAQKPHFRPSRVSNTIDW